MSGAERHVVTGTTPPKHEGGEREYFTAIVVLASDYDRDTARLRKEKSLAIAGMLENHNAFVKEFEAGTVTLLAERDELRAQVQAMRELLRKVAPHFAAPPGIGHLHAEIDAALQEDKP